VRITKNTVIQMAATSATGASVERMLEAELDLAWSLFTAEPMFGSLFWSCWKVS
jgi:hypothetical protein